MRQFTLTMFCLFMCLALFAQTNQPANAQPNTENIYTIKQQYLYNVLHNPNDAQQDEDDNDLARFNRWFHDVEVRTWPSGNLPRPDVLIRATEQVQQTRRQTGQKNTAGAPTWQPVGPMKVPTNHNGIGRVNCIVIDPLDTNKLYVGTACGGVFISHNHGVTWTSNSDLFPSLSISDIAINPVHTDTIYAATGDGYGYETGAYNIFWGGLYSSGVMKSTDGGNTWSTTGLSYLQSNKDMIQRLLIHPKKTNLLLAATRNGILRSTDAGATWTNVEPGHVYSMQFHPGNPDTIYAINNLNLRVSYNAGVSWSTLSAGLNPTGDRCTIGVSAIAPKAIWVLDGHNDLKVSHNEGYIFNATNPPDTAHFYGYYDRVLEVSPTDSNYILAFGMYQGFSLDGGVNWDILNDFSNVHVDNHAVAINPLKQSTFYCGNDGGISVTYDGGVRWVNLSNGLMISQIYRMSSSQQNPYVMVSGLQDNGTFVYDGTNWMHRSGGDGEACAIHPQNDLLQISSSQNGGFNMSYDQGLNFTPLHVSTESASWTAPVAFDPNDQMVIYFGYKNIYVTHDQGTSFAPVTTTSPFSGGATMLAVAPSNSMVIYAGDPGKIIRSTNGGTTWTTVTGNLPVSYVALTDIAIDPRDPMHVYATTSGYLSGYKLWMSTTGGDGTWTNISIDLPNLPADCIAIDTSTPGALFVGTDIGVYYTDSSQTGWTLYNTGLPNVIINDLEVNYANYKVRAATYGRGIWECNLKKAAPSGIKPVVKAHQADIQLYPNPTANSWKVVFGTNKPAKFNIKVTDVTGKVLGVYDNTDIIDASRYASGVYNLEVSAGDAHYSLKAIRE